MGSDHAFNVILTLQQVRQRRFFGTRCFYGGPCFAFLENLLVFSDEVKKELPDETDKFVGIDMDVKEILKNGGEIRSAKDFCNQGNVFQRLEKTQGQLTMCEKALNDFMDGKRRSFPRFYFMSSNDLLDVLSNGNSPREGRAPFPRVLHRHR